MTATAYVQHETEIITKIKAGLADAEAGRTIPHEEAMRRVREIIDAAKRRRA